MMVMVVSVVMLLVVLVVLVIRVLMTLIMMKEKLVNDDGDSIGIGIDTLKTSASKEKIRRAAVGQDGKVLRKSGGLGGHSGGGLGDLGGLGVPGGLVDQQHLGEERASSVVSDNPHLYSRSISMVGHYNITFAIFKTSIMKSLIFTYSLSLLYDNHFPRQR